MLMIALMLVLSLVVSCWDAFVAGAIWRETSGWMKVVAISSLVMAYCGFFQFAAIALGLVAIAAHWINHAALQALFSITYLLVIIPILGSGLIITIESWRQFIRSRNLIDGASAAYNAFAMGQNLYGMASSAPGAWENVVGFSSSDADSDHADAAILLLLIGVALFVAFGFTAWFFSMGKSAALRDLMGAR